MLRDFRKNKTFKRRLLISGGIQAVLTSVLVGRLGYLQVIKHDEYSTKSDKNRIKPNIIPAARGMVLDRNNVALTQNKTNYRLLLYNENRPDIEDLVGKLSKILLLDEKEQEIIFKKVKKSAHRGVIPLLNNLSWDDVARVESNYHNLSGLAIENGILRHYAIGDAGAHIVGYAGTPAEGQIDQEQKELFLHHNFKIGKSGIEKTFDEHLRGQFGIKYAEVNAFGIPIRTLSETPSQKGGRVKLTIDANLQKFIWQRMQNISGSAVVMDVNSGEILALNSTPSFDPNQFVEGISQEYWQKLMQNDDKPLNNKAIAASYPPGSTFKIIVAIAALESGLKTNKKHFCSGSYRLGDRDFGCWKRSGHGKLNMGEAIKNSCNSYFFDVANQIGIDKIAQVAQRFGYGEMFDIDVGKGRSGNLPSRKWKQQKFGEKWVGGDTLNTSIGQGFLLATPLQMAIVMARIANGGSKIMPHLIKNGQLAKQNIVQKKNLAKRQHIDFVIKAMADVVNDREGTAYLSRTFVRDFKMAGKTGTSQVVSRREEGAIFNKKYQNHAIFAGFAPANKPKYAVCVVAEHGGSGSKVAAPIARDILLKTKEML